MAISFENITVGGTFSLQPSVPAGPTVATTINGFSGAYNIASSDYVYLTGSAYGNGKFVAVGYDRYARSVVYTSTNPTVEDHYRAWTELPSIGTGYLMSVAYGNGKFVAVGYTPGGTGIYSTSTDGVNWSSLQGLELNGNLTAITYANGKFVVVGYNYVGGSLSRELISATSTDGTSWTATQNSGVAGIPSQITYGNGKFVAGSQVFSNSDGMRYGVQTSTDGVNWTAGSFFGPTGAYGNGIAFGNGKFVVAGIYSQGLYTSTDAVTWTNVSLNSSVPYADYGSLMVAFAGGNFVLTGYNFSGTREMLWAKSTDGSTWTNVQTASVSNCSFFISSGSAISFGNEHYVAVGYYYNLEPLSGFIVSY
jgi:hypothetical protein